MFNVGHTALMVAALAAGGETTAEVMAPIDLSELADGREDLNVALRAGEHLIAHHEFPHRGRS